MIYADNLVAHVRERFDPYSIEVRLVVPGQYEFTAAYDIDDYGRIQYRGEHDFNAEAEPVLRLSKHEAIALHSALGQYLGEDVQPLATARADLLHERARVDKMIEHFLSSGRRVISE